MTQLTPITPNATNKTITDDANFPEFKGNNSVDHSTHHSATSIEIHEYDPTAYTHPQHMSLPQIDEDTQQDLDDSDGIDIELSDSTDNEQTDKLKKAHKIINKNNK